MDVFVVTIVKKRAMHTKYGVLHLSRLEHLICDRIWEKVHYGAHNDFSV